MTLMRQKALVRVMLFKGIYFYLKDIKMSIAIYAKWEPMRSKGFASIAAGYTAIGTPLDHRAVIIYFDNTTDKEVTLSFDGVNDNFNLPALTFRPLEICTNKISSEGLFVPFGTTIYVKQSAAGAPGSGSVFVSAVWASTDGIKE
jgi:hypothetical protein